MLFQSMKMLSVLNKQKLSGYNMENENKVGTFDYDKYTFSDLFHTSGIKTFSVGIYKWELRKGRVFRSQRDLKKSKAVVRVTINMTEFDQGKKVVEHVTERLNNNTYDGKASVNANAYAKRNNIQ